MREQLAALAHEMWSGWMDYLFSKCKDEKDGTVTIPAWAVQRWKHQMVTPYSALTGKEQESDRVEADKILDIMRGSI